MSWLNVQLVSALCYGCLSIVMVLLNKLLMSSYALSRPSTILLPQYVCSIALAELLHRLKWIHLEPFSAHSLRSLLFIGVSYCLHAITSLTALSGMNVPLYAAIKRCTPVLNLFLAYVLLEKKKTPSLPISLTVIVTTGGCVLAALGDIESDLRAYSYGAFSVLCQGLYMTLIQRKSGQEGFHAIDIFYYNCLTSLLITALYGVALGEFAPVTGNADERAEVTMSFVLTYLTTIVASIALNFSIIWCTVENSALTTSIVGALKQVIQSIIGAIWFGGVSTNLLFVVGILLNFAGSFLYTYLKAMESTSAVSSLEAK